MKVKKDYDVDPTLHYEGLRRLRDPEPFTDSRLGFNLQNIKRRPT